MKGFGKYINEQKVPKGETYNFLVLAGGRLNIQDKTVFLQKYLACFPHFSVCLLYTSDAADE